LFEIIARFMIACDQCGIWFHGNCVEVSEEDAELMKEENVAFVCCECKKPGTTVF